VECHAGNSQVHGWSSAVKERYNCHKGVVVGQCVGVGVGVESHLGLARTVYIHRI
jgi:hypothetical protein